MEQFETPEVAGVEAALATLGGKWKILILWHLAQQTRRYGELKRLMPKITEKMLIQQLRELERDKLITRTEYPGVPPKVEYSFSEYGSSLEPIIKAMCNWGKNHLRLKLDLEPVL